MKNYQGNLKELLKCEDEPIQDIGRIQKHGCLLVLEQKSLKVLQCSASVKEYLGKEAAVVLNKTFVDFLSKDEQATTLDWLAHISENDFLPCTILTSKSKQTFYTSAYLSDSFIVLELEPFSTKEIKRQLSYDNFTAQIVQKIAGADTLKAVAQIAAKGLYRFLDCDRVCVFQYDGDFNGNIIAEKTKKGIKSYLNHRFPQSDIPKQARAMLKQKRLRYISNVESQAVDIIPYNNPRTHKPTNLLESDLRNPSEIHLEYLVNMGVKTSLTISVIVGDELWGLIFCQNETLPKYIPYAQRKACENLGYIFSQSVQRTSEYTDVQKFDKLLKKEYQVVRQINKDLDLVKGALAHSVTVLDLNSAQGVALSYNDTLFTLGKTPHKTFIKSILHWLVEEIEDKVFSTRYLSKHLPEAERYEKTASGILSLEISKQSRDYIIWFKPEVVETITWGGNPHKEIEKIVGEKVKLSPRTTFDSWLEKSRAKSLAWESYEIKVAEHFRNNLLEALKLKNTYLEKANKQLQESLKKEQQLNAELTSAEEELRQTYQFQSQIVKKLSLSETQLKAIYNTTTDSNLLIGKDYKIISFNKEAAYQTRKIFDKEVLIDRDIRTFFSPQSAEDFEKYFQRTLKGETLHTRRRFIKNNQKYWYKVSYYPVYNIEDKIWAVSFNSTDITMQVLAQQEAEKLALVAKHTKDAVIITDKEGFIEWTNEGFEKMMGYTLEEARHRKPGDLLQGKDTNPHTVAQISQAIKLKKPIRCDILNYSKKGKKTWINLYIQPIFDKTGNIYQFFGLQIDITENKSQEAIISESRERYKRMAEQYRLLADNTADLITKHEIDSTYLYLSPSVYHLLGYKVADLLGKKAVELLYPEDIPKVKAYLKKALEGQNIQVSYRMFRKDRSLTWVETTGRVLLNQGVHNNTHLLAITRDISEKMKMAKLLDDTSKVSRVGGWEVNLLENPRQPKWTDETYRIHELPIGTTVSMEDAINFYHPEDREAVAEFVDKLIYKGESYEFELRLNTAKGRQVWVKTVGNREVIDGKVTRIYGTFQDVTENKKVRIALIDTTKSLNIAAKSAQIGVWEWDIANNRLHWDNMMYQVYGIDKRNLQNTYETWKSTLHKEDKVQAEEEVRLALENKKVFDTEFRILTSEKELRYVKAFAEVIFDQEGKAQRMIGVNWDITKERESERALILEKERAEEMNRLKTNFLANMSHEIRTPINGILGLAQIIKDETNVNQIHEYVDLQYQSGKRLLHTITSILQLSRLEAESRSFEFAEVNINDILSHIVKSLSGLAYKKGLYLDFASSDDNLICLGNEDLFYQIFNNIIGNAIKFTSKGGVKVFTKKVDENSKYLRIYVKDTGIGIKEDFLPQIFNSFEQESSGMRRSHEGSGLGLSIAKKYIELLEGKIEVRSKKGQGSTFTVYLLTKKL